jgi:hypothetical protein
MNKKSAGDASSKQEGSKNEPSAGEATTWLEAIYRPAGLPEQAGNPLIEALPPFRTAADAISAFGRFPPISKGERQLPKETRMQCICRLDQYVEPLPKHFELVEQVGLLIRSGYISRNPLDPGHSKMMKEFYRRAMVCDEIVTISPTRRSTAPSMALFGVSGVGKSTAIERALSFYPQVLHHKEHGFIQICWLKIDCPLDGSLKQFLMAFLDKVDALLGSNWRRTFGRVKTVDELIGHVARVAATHHLGLLVMDEVQNLVLANGVGQEKMINFFVTLSNEVKIPYITIGTPRGLSFLEGVFREARRVSDMGGAIWDAFSEGEEWEHFIRGMWKYQWTTKSVNLAPPDKFPDDLSSALFDETQGITALVVRLFQLAQIEAIRNGDEILTPMLIREVAKEKFRLLAPVLEAMRSKNDEAIGKYEDLLTNGLKNLGKDIDKEARLAKLKAARTESQTQVISEKKRAISALVDLGMEEDSVMKLVDDAFERQGMKASADVVVSILRSVANAGAADKKNRNAAEKKQAASPPTRKSRLNEIVDGSGNAGEGYDALRQAGIIAPHLESLPAC